MTEPTLDPHWRERIAHALRIQAETRARRDRNPVGIVRYRPLRVGRSTK